MSDIAIKSAILAALGWVVFASLRRASAATRYLVLVLTVVVLAALPLVLPFLPQWHAPFVRIEVPVSSAVSAQSSTVPDARQFPWLIAIWGAGFAILGLRIAVIAGRLFYRSLSLRPVRDLRLLEVAEECCGERGRGFLLMLGNPGNPPMTWGFLRPVLVLPPESIEWSSDRLRSVMLHEIAHIERADWLTNLIADCVCAAYWPNPLVWLIAQAMARESEKAADDRVLSQGLRASQYAGHLLEIVRETRGQAPSSAVAMARSRGLDGRVRAILSEAACRRPVRGSAALGWVVACAVVALGVGGAVPTIVEKVSPESVSRTQRRQLVTDLSPREISKPESYSAVGVTPATPETPELEIPSAPIAHHVTAAPHQPVVSAAASSKVDSADAVGITVPPLNEKDFDLGDMKLDIKDEETRAQVEKDLREAKQEYKRAMEQANRDVAQSLKDVAPHVKIDVSAITKAALQSASEGLKQGMEEIRKAGLSKKSAHVRDDESHHEDPPDPRDE